MARHSDMDVKLSLVLSLNLAPKKPWVTVHGTGILDTGIPASWTSLRIAMSALRGNSLNRSAVRDAGAFLTGLPCRALVFIHKSLRDTVVLAGMPEPRHREVTLRITQVPVEPPSYRPWRWIPASMPVWRLWNTRVY